MLNKLVVLMAAILLSGGAAAGTVSSTVNISGEITGECFIVTSGILFGSIPTAMVSSSSAVANWQVTCTAPMSYTMTPDSLGNASLWTFNNGQGKNVASGPGTVWMTLKINGAPFPISGVSKVNNGGTEIHSIEAKLTPVGSYTGSVSQTIQPTLTWM